MLCAAVFRFTHSGMFLCSRTGTAGGLRAVRALLAGTALCRRPEHCFVASALPLLCLFCDAIFLHDGYF